MRIVVTGSNGQLGRALQRVIGQETLYLVDLPEHDITNLDHTIASVTAFRPDLVIHAAAITDVDGCEKDPELAYRVNAWGTRNVAVSCQRSGCPLVYISTDYVFDGTKGEPYWEYDEPNPLSVYARSKLAGETLVQTLLSEFYVVRTAWLYDRSGKNFVKTVLRLAEERDSLRMVTDESGSPTYAPDLAVAVARLIQTPAYGIYHFTNLGTCSRFEWASRALQIAGKPNYALSPSTDYQRAATVPKHVELRNSNGTALGITLRPWAEALEEYLG